MASRVDWGSMGWVYPTPPHIMDLVCPSAPKMASLLCGKWKCSIGLGMMSSRCGICGSGIQEFE